jgi:hypothetical protein
MLNVFQVVAQFVVGRASDKFKFSSVAIAATSSLVSAPLLLLWWFSKSFAELMVFAILFGLFAGGYSVLWPRFNTSLTNDADTQLFLYGWLAFGRGLGNLLAVPVQLVNKTSGGTTDPTSAFRYIIIFAGTALLLSGFMSTASLAMSWLHTRRTKTLMSSDSTWYSTRV